MAMNRRKIQRVITNGKDQAYMIYTSGSTGRPKGVPNVHEGIVNRLLWMQDAYRLNGSDRVMQKTPYSFDVSVWEFFWPLMTGACLVVARPEGHKDPNYLVELIQAAGRSRQCTLCLRCCGSSWKQKAWSGAPA